jgi:hypothetical protein
MPFLNQTELEKNPGLLIPIARWSDQFDESLKKIGVDINTTEIKGVCILNIYLIYSECAILYVSILRSCSRNP